MSDWIHIGQQVASRWFITLIDILMVAFILYRLLLLARGTRAWQLMVGLLIFSLALYLSDVLHLETLHWLLDRATALGPVALAILFFPELRRVLESIGRVGFWRFGLPVGEEEPMRRAIQEVVQAVSQMARERIGALIVWERADRLELGRGVTFEAEVAAPLLKTIFYPGSPLHDGAVVIREDKIVEAAVYLPELSENEHIPDHFHTRHRAGIGITEHYDCIAIIVSEETGRLTVALDGGWMTDLDAGHLHRILEDLFIRAAEPPLFQKMGRAIAKVRLPGRRPNSTHKVERGV